MLVDYCSNTCCAMFFLCSDADAIFPIMTRNTVQGCTLTVAKLELSEEKSFKQSWLDIENLFFTAKKTLIQIQPGLEFAKSETKKEIGRVVGASLF